MTDQVDSRRTTDSFRDRFRATQRLRTFSRDILTHLEEENSKQGTGYRLNGLPLRPRANAVVTSTMSHLAPLHQRLSSRVTKLMQVDAYKSMDRIKIRNDGGVSVLAVHLDLGLVYAVRSQDSVHSLLYTFDTPKAVGGNDVEASPPVGEVDGINSTDNSFLTSKPALNSERPFFFELDSERPEIEEDEGSECVVVKSFKMIVNKLILLYKQLWIGGGTNEPDGVNQLCDHVGHHVTLTCLGVKSFNGEFHGMVCDQHGEIRHSDCEMHYCPAQFRILFDNQNATSTDHIVSILCLGMGPNQNFFLTLFTDNTWGTRFAVQRANGSGKKLQVPTASKFHFRMTKGDNGYRFQAVAGDQRYLAFSANGKQEIINDPSDLKSQFVFTPISD